MKYLDWFLDNEDDVCNTVRCAWNLYASGGGVHRFRWVNCRSSRIFHLLTINEEEIREVNDSVLFKFVQELGKKISTSLLRCVITIIFLGVAVTTT